MARMWTIAASVARTVARSVGEAIIGATINLVAGKFAEMLTDMLFAMFERQFKGWVEDSNAYKSRKVDVVNAMKEIYEKFGKDVGDNLVDLAKEQASNNCENAIENECEDYLIDAASSISEHLTTKSQ